MEKENLIDERKKKKAYEPSLFSNSQQHLSS